MSSGACRPRQGRSSCSNGVRCRTGSATRGAGDSRSAAQRTSGFRPDALVVGAVGHLRPDQELRRACFDGVRHSSPRRLGTPGVHVLAPRRRTRGTGSSRAPPRAMDSPPGGRGALLSATSHDLVPYYRAMDVLRHLVRLRAAAHFAARGHGLWSCPSQRRTWATSGVMLAGSEEATSASSTPSNASGFRGRAVQRELGSLLRDPVLRSTLARSRARARSGGSHTPSPQ